MHIRKCVSAWCIIFVFYLDRWFPPVITPPYMKMDAMCIVLRSWLAEQHRDNKARSEPLGSGVLPVGVKVSQCPL